MKKFVRVGALVLIFGLILGLIVFNLTHKEPVSKNVWDMGMTIGNADTATRHYVQYSDFACPYCDHFSRAVIEHEEEFNKFLEDHKILYEIRLTEIIYDSVGSEMSRDSAVAAYCAKRENKFIDYYHAGVMALYKDYHSKGIGDSKTSTPITNMPEDYWVKIGKEIGLSSEFENCIKNKETLNEVKKNTLEAEKYAQGLPFFQFEKATFAGLSATVWDWEHTLAYLEAGLK